MEIVEYISSTLILSEKYEVMLSKINDYIPNIDRDTHNFYKTQSQFMDSMFTISAPTPMRNLRQILSEINRSKMALQEAFFINKKKEVEIKKKEEQVEREKGYDLELLLIEIAEIKSQIENSKNYIEGAIRKVLAYIEQYKSILSSLEKSSITEEEFEEEEEKYHIMKSFEQALCAARARSGVIDEGNHIYFFQIGINGGSAQYDISEFLIYERNLLITGQYATHDMVLEFLLRMAKKYKGCSGTYAKTKNMSLIISDALHG